MGIRSKIKKRLPIFGRRYSEAPTSVPASPMAPPSAPEPEEPKSLRGDQDVQEFIQKFIDENKVAIFMKGSPDQPQCGFSANSSALLRSYGKPFAHFDVISDYDVREGVKEFSEWPTLPQIYLGGEFVGGNDILEQMHTSGDLKKELEVLFPED